MKLTITSAGYTDFVRPFTFFNISMLASNKAELSDKNVIFRASFEAVLTIGTD